MIPLTTPRTTSPPHGTSASDVSSAPATDAVARARAAQPDWAARALGDRVAVLRRFHEGLYAARGELAALIAHETGKPTAEAMAAEVLVTLEQVAYAARRARHVLAPDVARWTSLAAFRKRIVTRQVPHGVVGVISPWNYPLMLAAGAIVPHLVAGNAVVFKPSELTPRTGERLVALLHAAGVPPDVLIRLPGDGAVGAALVAAAVDKVAFTGSTAVGGEIAQRCAERLVPCTLELGGSDAAIVCADADLALTAAGIAWGRFANAGQNCVSPKVVYVEAALHDALVAALAARLRALRPGVDTAPCLSVPHADGVRAQLADAVARGARVVAEGPSVEDPRWVTPTLLADVSPSMRVLTEEVFGPVLPVVPVRDVDDAVARVNAGPFGLAASVWTRDAARGRRIAARLAVGSVTVNDALVSAGLAAVDYGGVRRSGWGRSHGDAGLRDAARPHVTVEERFPGWRQAYWFPYREDAASAWDAVVRLAHGPWRDRAAALPRVARWLIRRGDA